MKKLNKLIAVGLALVVITGCLSGCGGSSATASETVTTHRITKKTVGAIKAEDTSEIDLGDYKVKLTEDYRYAVSTDDKTEISTYFVWNPTIANANADAKDGRSGDDYELALQEAFESAKQQAIEEASRWNPFNRKKEETIAEIADDVYVFDKDAYITAYSDEVVMILYSGIDRTSPAGTLTGSQVKASGLTYYQNSLVAGVPSMRNTLWDTSCVPNFKSPTTEENIAENKKIESINGDFYALTFTGNSGDYMNTTYGTQVYPKSYYGIYLLEKEVQEGSVRRWYSIIFANDSVGNVADKGLYDLVFSQLRSTFGITLYYTTYDKDNWAYRAEEDFSKGRSYPQFLDSFSNTFDYYIMQDNKKINDSKKDEVTESSESSNEGAVSSP